MAFLYIHLMFKISQKPSHGYESLQDIEAKTEGSGARPRINLSAVEKTG